VSSDFVQKTTAKLLILHLQQQIEVHQPMASSDVLNSEKNTKASKSIKKIGCNKKIKKTFIEINFMDGFNFIKRF